MTGLGNDQGRKERPGLWNFHLSVVPDSAIYAGFDNRLGILYRLLATTLLSARRTSQQGGRS